MSSKLTIKPEDWFEQDSKWFVNLPFECDDNVDTIIEFTDDSEYIDNHKDDFDSLNNGITENNICKISSNHKIGCDINIEIKTIDEAGGEVLYEKDGTPKYVPANSQFDFSNILSSLSPGVVNEISNVIDGEIKTISTDENK